MLLRTSSTSILSSSNTCLYDFVKRDDSSLLEGGEWDFERHFVPWLSISKVQYESDLQNFSHGFISSAKVAADGFLNSATHKKDGRRLNIDSEIPCSHQRRWSRWTSLRRHSSLPSNISTFQGKMRSEQVFALGDDVQFRLLELKELNCTAEDIVEEAKSSTSTDDLIRESNATNSKLGYFFKEQDDGSLESAKLAAIRSGITSSGEEIHSPKSVLESEARDMYAYFEEVDLSHHRRAEIEQASTSGRQEETYFVIDGERYTDIRMGANGVAVACNSRGCRPLNTAETLGPMFIAGGLGVGTAGGADAGVFDAGKVGGREYESKSGKGEEKFIKMLEDNPGHPLLLRNYARYLFEVRRDYEKAEGFFERAILAGPGDGEVLSQYAQLIWQVYHDEPRAGSYFEQAVQAAPDDCHVLAAYASFLRESEDTQQEMELFQSCTPVHEPLTPVSA